jgi:hypothetical protein
MQLTGAVEVRDWPTQRDAARFARAQGISEAAIAWVYARYTGAAYACRSVKWWGTQFQLAAGSR